MVGGGIGGGGMVGRHIADYPLVSAVYLLLSGQIVQNDSAVKNMNPSVGLCRMINSLIDKMLSLSHSFYLPFPSVRPSVCVSRFEATALRAEPFPTSA